MIASILVSNSDRLTIRAGPRVYLPNSQFVRRTMPRDVRVFLNLFVESKELERVTENLTRLPEVTDVFEVTGEYDIVCMLKVENILAFRELLKNKVLKISGVKSTVSSVVLYTHKREGKPIAE